MFKMTADALESGAFIFSKQVFFPAMGAATLCGLAALSWVIALQFIPLNRAYPFMALGFLLVPAAGWLFFGEQISIPYLIGLVLIVAGVILTTISR